MKRLFTIFFALLLGITAAFAQTQPTLPYQAVVRDNQNHLLKDADVSIDVQIYEGATLRYSETQTPHSNANGLISFNIGAGSGATGTMADVADWRVAKFKFTYHLTDGDVVVTDSVHAVPYALQTAFATGGNFLTSDSAVITTMQGNIATNTTNITTNTTDIAALANRVNTFNTNVCDSVKDCDFSGNTSIQNMLQELSDLISAQNHKIDSLGHIVDSLSNLPHGNTPTDTFNCGTDKVKDADNNEYNTVLIGEQCWMKENMKTTKFANGTEIALGGVSSTTPYRYYPNGDASNVATFGYLYNWTAAMNGASSTDEVPSGVQGICPDGWHIPSNAEWYQLTDFLSSNEDYVCDNNPVFIAKSVAATTEWNTYSSGCVVGSYLPTNNATGFTALPAGHYESNNGRYTYFRQNTGFWSSSLKDTDVAYKTYLYYISCNVEHYDSNIQDGCSVRCLRDPEAGGGTTPSAPATMSCEQVMECMGDTLGKLNTKIEEQGTEIETLNGTVTTQGQTIETLNSTVESQGNTIDSLAHLVDSLSNLIPGGEPAATFTCGTDKVKDVENNEYNTVLIGEQCWMKENLRTTKKPNNEAITDGMWEPGTNSVETYGRLYSWTTMMNGESSSEANPSGVQGICPDGWHVPSDAEWTQLTDYVNTEANGYRCDGDGTIANALSSSTGWQSPSDCGAGHNSTTLNATGFSAVPAGYCFGGSFYDFGGLAYFWSATENEDFSAWRRDLIFLVSNVIRNNANKDYGYSVRCVRNAETGGGDTPGDDEPTIVDTVTCYPNLGSNVPEKKTVTRGENLDLSTTFTHPTETNWEIAGWNTSADGTGTSYTNTITTSGNLTLYAQWHTFCTGTPNTSVNEFGSNRIDSLQDADNNKYTVVQIGNQCWMKENLRTTKKPNNENITEGMWEPGSNSVETYGRLYDWTTMMNGGSSSVANPSGVQGICPTGWHVPSDAEWKQMEMAVGMSESDANGTSFRGSIAVKLSGNTGWNSSANDDAPGNTYAPDRNSTGFSALPAGYYRVNGHYVFSQGAYFWSATAKGSDDEAYGRSLHCAKAGVSRAGIEYIHGFSVRCVRDAEAGGGNDTPKPCTAASRGSRDPQVAGTYTPAHGSDGLETVDANENITSVKDIDNNEYKVVEIGSQCWMAVNLRTTHYADNTPITLGTTSNKSTEVGYYYDYSSDDPSIPLEQRGYLYNWPAAMKSTSNPEGTQGICPTGWHLPTMAEWQTMVAQAGASTSTGAVYLSASRYWNGSNPATDGMTPNSYDNPDRNKSGFSAVPAGFFDSSSFVYSGNNANFWSSSLDGSYAWCRYLDSGNTNVRENKLPKNRGYSVRCVRD